ncbi:MAG: DUF4197 domain-containing protein [Pseudomonadota bacterium]
MTHFIPTAVTKKLSLAVLCLAATSAMAASLADLSNLDATSGLKAALERGAVAAVGKLGAENGFLHNDQVKIGLPRVLEKARPLLNMTGQGERLDELVLDMNHAAEMAVPLAKPLLIKAVKSLTVRDAKLILSGGDTSVTDFFREKTSGELALQFLPIVKKVTDRSDLSAKYNGAMGKVGRFSAIPPEQATVEDYVTHKAVDGLFKMIAEEERDIRRDPIGTGSKILSKVFGSL